MSSKPSTPAKPPKQMSSRLLTMKFMQRAAASASPSSPATPDGPSPKRQKTSPSGGKGAASASAGGSDSDAIKAALEAEEAKRQEALDKQAAEAGETKWVLSFRDGDSGAADADDQARSSSTSTLASGTGKLRVVHAGYAGIDAPTSTSPSGPRRIVSGDGDDDADDTVEEEGQSGLVGRRSFGKFNKTLEKQRKAHRKAHEAESNADRPDRSDRKGNEDDDDDDDEEESSDEDEDEDEEEQEETRRKYTPRKEVNLNKLSSISGGGAGLSSSSRQGPNAADMDCFKCGKRGHLKKDCPAGAARSASAVRGKKGKRKST
ncbi:hypothetical protein L228DRAFT_284908 [Xylona heveae TC161]|uniref:CCHC-type domain-containing protein n=1 Tax=Xylona heveae (strain CBS 132557 / TC161) TaxID=1328760 RepID=A0A165AAI1_XYLHT|nr:hypothetical protein L228DRAFT_284908 [Xylona heveae TC161]KZF20173.1 hypothetical protein L228DRAFT_284908 [Xylona heveae TC161]